MLGLPKSTEFGRRIPKQKFYENLNISPALKRMFVEQVKTIYWRNKIAVQTMNLAAGTAVTEIEVFEVKLNSPELGDSFFLQIDREIPYHILFVLEYEGRCRAVIGYKELASSGSNAFKVNCYYRTEWMPEEELPLKIEGLNMDAVYENFVRQIAGEQLWVGTQAETLKESIDRAERRQQLQKEIAKLQAKIRKEKQLNKQVQMNVELKKLKREFNVWEKDDT